MNINARTKILLIFVISIFPMFMGWFLYHYRDHFQFKTTNLGTLVNPPLHTAQFEMKKDMTPLWKIIYAPGDCCDAQCQKTMYTLHQLRLVLGKDSRRVGLNLVENSICKTTDTHDFQKVNLTKQESLIWQQALSPKSAHFQVENKIYLVDPAGNLFMYYPSSVDAMHILKDLKRVLEVSQIG